MSKLTAEGRADFARLEKTIREGLETFVAVGEALAEIKERMLFKEVCSTFEAYVQIRWGFSRRHADRQIQAAETAKLLTASLDPGVQIPTTEKVVRPLTEIPAENRADVWKAAVDEAGGEQPTAKQVAAKAAPHKREQTPAQKARAAEKRAAKSTRPPEVPKADAKGGASESEAERKAPRAVATADEGSSGTGEPVGARSENTESESTDAGGVNLPSKSPRVDGAPGSDDRTDLPSDVPPAPKSTAAVVEAGAPSVVVTVLASLPTHLPNPSSVELAPLTQADVDRLLSLGRWAQMCAARWALMQKQATVAA